MNYNSRFLDHEHHDVAYLKRDDIGLVISKALSETYQTQPSKPIEFFAKYLLNHSKTQKKAQAVSYINSNVIFYFQKYLHIPLLAILTIIY